MKKLLIAIAAAATAIGTYAATAIGGAGFDTADDSKYSWTQDGGFSASTWVGADGDGVMTRKTDGLCTFTKDARPAGYNSKNDDGFMALKTTFGNPVTQNANEGSTKKIGSGFYYDGLVKFTACDETPDLNAAAYADSKIGFFPLLESDEDGADAYLYVWAAGGTNLWKTTKKIDDQWHRVTVKMIENVYKTGTMPGFVVFIDGSAVNCVDAKAVFTEADLTPAARKWWNDGMLFGSLTTSTEVTGVLYDGQGAIDEVGFTDEAPDFAADAQYYSVAFGDTISELYIGTSAEDFQTFTASPAEIMQAEGLKYWYKAAEGYVSKPFAQATDLTGDVTTPVIADGAAFKIGENAYATWADAVAAAVDGAKTISLVADYEMTETDLAASIENTMLTTLDLNGKTLTGCVNAATDIAITNGVAEVGGIVGVVTSAEDPTVYAVIGGAAVYVSAGQFDGFVIPTETEAKSITGGSFAELGTGSEVFYLAANVADGYEAVYAANYWTVQEAAAPSTAEVTINAENVTVTVMAGETPVASGESVEVGTVLTITATPATDYELATLTVKGAEFTSGSTYTVVEGDAGNTIAIAATATAIPYVVQIEGGAKYLSFEDALTNAADGATIKFLADFKGVFKTGVYGTSTNFVNGLTIDLNKFTWTLDGAANERSWEDRCGNSFKIMNGSLKAVKGSANQKIAFYTYAETLEFNDVALDFSELAMGASADPADPRTDVPIVSQNGNVKFTGNTTVKLAANQRLVTMLDRASAAYEPGTLTLDVNGSLPGDILLYSACSISVGENTTLSGKVYTGAAACSGFEAAGVAGSPFVAMVGAILPKTGSTSVNTRGGQLFTSVAAANEAIATTALTKNIIVLQDASADALSVASGTVNVVIPADVTLTATTSLALNGAKVALAEGGKLVAPAALNIASDFVAPGEGLEIKVAGEGPYTYTVGEAAPQGIEPGQTIGLGNPGEMTLEQAQAAAAALPIALTADDTAAGLTTDSLCVKAVLIGGAYKAVVDVKPELAPAVKTTAEKPIEVTDATFSAVVKDPVVGLYYYFTASATVDGTYAPAGDAVRATAAGVTLTAPKGGAASFYKLNVAVRPPVAE